MIVSLEEWDYLEEDAVLPEAHGVEVLPARA